MNKATISAAAIGAAVLMLLPFVSAFTGSSLSWSSSTIPVLSTNTATVTYGSGDSACPVGGTYQGLLTVTGPNGPAAFFVGPEPCGTVVHVVYPNDFIGGASTNTPGNYLATFVGSTSAGMHFSLSDGFTVNSLGVPK